MDQAVVRWFYKKGLGLVFIQALACLYFLPPAFGSAFAVSFASAAFLP